MIDGFLLSSRLRSRIAMLAMLSGACGPALAESALPFEGTWIRADRVCTTSAPSARTYTSRVLITSGGRCVLRKVAFGAGEYEIFEDCHRTEREGHVVEKIKMAGPDAMVLKFQENRLKIPRGRKFVRCTVAAPKPPVASPGRVPVAPGPKLAPPPPSPAPAHDAE